MGQYIPKSSYVAVYISVGKTINSPLLTHKIAISLSLMRIYVLYFSDVYCRLTHKFAKTGSYASEEETGDFMRQHGSRTGLVEVAWCVVK
jgi:hypothetical protein